LAEDADAGHDCTVENLNTLGACISFDATTFAELPHKFDLTFDNCHTYWHCDVIWQDGDVGRVGVSWKTCWPCGNTERYFSADAADFRIAVLFNVFGFLFVKASKFGPGIAIRWTIALCGYRISQNLCLAFLIGATGKIPHSGHWRVSWSRKL
jgi:hypothetical protein